MQKRLLALVATVAIVLSGFAGVVFAAGEFTLTVDTPEVARDLTPSPITVSGTFTGIYDDSEPTAVTVSGGVVASSAVVVEKAGTEADPHQFSFTIPGNTPEGTYTFTLENDGNDGTGSFKVVTANSYRMTLHTEEVIAGGATTQLVVGSITRSGTAASPTTNFLLEVYYAGIGETTQSIKQTVNVTNYQFSFYLPTNVPVQDVTFKLFESNDAFAKGSEVTSPVLPELPVRYNVDLSTKLEFPYTDGQSPVAITGKITDRDGKPVAEGTAVQLAAPNSVTLNTVTNAAGEFAYVVLRWEDTGAIELRVEGLGGAYFVHEEGKVVPKDASITVTPKSAVHSLLSVPVSVSGSGFPTGTTSQNVTLTLWRGDNEITSIGTVTTPLAADGTISATSAFSWIPSVAGTYTVKATYLQFEASATITVTNPLSYNFINSEQLTKLPVDSTHQVKIGNVSGGTYLMKYDGTTTTTTFVYDVYVDGVQKVTKQASATIDVPTTKLGSKTFRVIAYVTSTENGTTVYTKEYEQTFIGQITGWDVTMEPAELTVNKTQDISFVIKDKDGVPVNNATIEIDGKVYASPSTHNVQNGTYVIEDVKFTTVGTRDVVVKQGANLRASLKLDVVGERVYNVTSNVDTLLQRKAQDVKLTVTRDGNAVIPQRIRVIENKVDPKELSFTPEGNGVVKVNVNATKAGELILRVENFDGTLCGEVTINVVAPQLVLINEDAANATDNFKTDVHFKVVDPRDDSVIKSNLYLEGSYVTELVLYNEHGGTIVNDNGVFTILGAEEHKLTILAKGGQYEDAEDEEEEVLVALRVGAKDGALVDGEFLVKEATIESDPGMIIVGAQNNLTLTYKDANDNPIVGKEIKAGTASLGKTNDDGQVIFPVGMPTGSIEVTGATDVKDVVVKHTIKIGYDSEAPQVDYTLDGNKATIVISDNVRLVRINIDGVDVDFWPGAKYEFVRTLQPGVNKFAIKAQDSSDNVFDEVVEIEYLTDAIVLKGDQVQRQGEYLFVQARQFEDFGAQFAWNQATKTATFVLDDVKVEVTIGSTTAKVNGETVTMPVAPFLANDRTYVPVRFISENLGWNVHWAAGDVVTITLP